MSLQANNYSLFTDTDFKNIIGKNLNSILSSEGDGNPAGAFITYVSVFIKNYITEQTGKHLFKELKSNSPEGFILKLGRTKGTAFTLTSEQVEAIKLACVYQADYIIDNGSPERMSGLSISSRTAILDKRDLESYKICDISRAELLGAGLLYAGIGSGLNAWIK